MLEEGGPSAAGLTPADLRSTTGVSDFESTLVDRITSAAGERDDPDRIGPYRIVRFIGSGGMGHVYLAEDDDGHPVAVKIAQLGRPHAADSVRIEGERLPLVGHPNIVKFVARGEQNGRPWIATEYIEGHALMGTPDAPITPPVRDDATLRRAMTWFRDLAAALAALHESKLVHRDVKPNNIIVDAAGVAHLIDLGLAVTEGTGTRLLEGTVQFIAPEQVYLGSIELTGLTDQFSLAATFHHVLTGQYVRRQYDKKEHIRRAAVDDVGAPSNLVEEVPSSLDPIFRRALQKDSRKRYPNCGALAEDIGRWLDDKPLMYETESRRVIVGRFLRRHPKVTAAVIVGIVGLLVFLGNGFMASQVQQREHRNFVNATLDESRRLRLAGCPLDALNLLRGRRVRLQDEASYHDEFERVAGEAKNFIVDELFGNIVFTATDDDGVYRPAIDNVRADLEVMSDAPAAHYVVSAFGHLVDEDYAAGLAVLSDYEQDGTRPPTPMMNELRGLLLARQIDRALDPRVNASAADVETELLALDNTTPCAAADDPRTSWLRALRLLWMSQLARTGKLNSSFERTAETTEILRHVLATQWGGQSHVTRNILGQNYVLEGRHLMAWQTFDDLFSEITTDLDRACVASWQIRAGLLLDANESRSRRLEELASVVGSSAPIIGRRLVFSVTAFVLFENNRNPPEAGRAPTIERLAHVVDRAAPWNRRSAEAVRNFLGMLRLNAQGESRRAQFLLPHVKKSVQDDEVADEIKDLIRLVIPVEGEK